MRMIIDTEKLNYDTFPTETGEPGDEFITRKKLESLSTIHTLFLCDGKKCNNCSYPTCKHTRDLNHAQNFEHYDLRATGLAYNHTGTPISKVKNVDLENGIIELEKINL